MIRFQGKPPIWSWRGGRVTVNIKDPLVGNGSRAEWFDRFTPEFGVTCIYPLTMRVPSSWKECAKAVIVAQWHSSDAEAVGMPPPLAFEIRDSNWRIVSRWDDQKVSTISPDAAGRKKLLWTAPFVKDQEEVFSVSVKWGWAPAGDPLTGWIEVSRNGEVLFQHFGPNCYNDERAPYAKCGVYVPDWLDVDEFSMYYKF